MTDVERAAAAEKDRPVVERAAAAAAEEEERRVVEEERRVVEDEAAPDMAEDSQSAAASAVAEYAEEEVDSLSSRVVLERCRDLLAAEPTRLACGTTRAAAAARLCSAWQSGQYQSPSGTDGSGGVRHHVCQNPESQPSHSRRDSSCSADPQPQQW